MNLWIAFNSAKKIRPFGWTSFECFVNGCRPGWCIKAYSFMGFGAAEFVLLDNRGKIRLDRRNPGLFLTQWLFGRVKFHRKVMA
jgi:hypothetical protein